jgi:O-antigen/teichoic acid export membrane protein
VPHEEIGESLGPRRGAKLLFIGLTVSQICALIRYTFLARLLGPEQLGLAATVILTQQFFESISESGADRFLIQDRHGDTHVVQNLLHSVYAGRGLFTAAALLLTAYPLAHFYGAPTLAGGLMLLSIAPLLAGLQHLDIRRKQRANDFSIEGMSTLISELVSICVTLVSAFVLHSYVAAILGVIAKSATMAVVTHHRAERPYRFGYSKEHAARLAGFGGPLFLNAVILYFGSQGDRMIVGNQLGLTELGRYSAVMLLIFYPSAIMNRYIYSLFLPRLSAQLNNPAGRAREANVLGAVTLLLSLGMCAGFALVGPFAVQILYGRKFILTPDVIALMGVLLTFRVFRNWPVIVAMGMGKTGVVLADNLARLVGLAAAVAAALISRNLSSVLMGLILGELFALVLSLVLTNRALHRNPLWDFDRVVVYVLASAVIYGLGWEASRPNLLAIAALCGGGALTCAWIARREAATVAAALSSFPLPDRIAKRLRLGGIVRGGTGAVQAAARPHGAPEGAAAEAVVVAKAHRQAGRGEL